MATTEDDPINDKPMPLLDHLIELRRRLIWSAGTFLICFFIAYYFSGAIYYFLAEPLAAALGRQPQPKGDSRRTWAAFGALALVLAVARIAVPVARVDGAATPRTALAKVQPSLAARPMLNSYDFGGYLIVKGVKPFIDGRSDMYGDAQFLRFLQIRGGDRPSLDAAVRRYGVAWTMLQPGEPLVAVLDATPGWRRLYADRYAVVHERIAPAAASVAQPDGHGAATR